MSTTGQETISAESALYQGFVRHRRFTPRRHEFDYPLFMFWLKAEEIPTLLQRFWQMGTRPLSWARFRRSDYIGEGAQPLAASVRQKMAELSGCSEADFTGDVYALCHLRYLGFYFSPLNLYFQERNDGVKFMLAEVSNTPWNERHYYLLNLDDCQAHDKEFHVSPFNPLAQQYRWRIRAPGSERSDCMIHIESWEDAPASHNGTGQEKIFDATLSLQRIELNRKTLNRVLLKTPIQTASMVMGIYWQALRLLLKKVPLHSHPEKLLRKQPGHEKS